MDLATIIETYRGPLIGLIASWGAPWAEAAEIAQDSFAEAWMNRAACRGDWADTEVFGRWLRGVAWNRHRNWTRGRRRHRVRFVKLDPAQVVAVTPADEPGIEDALDALRRAIARLPPQQRQVVLMHYLEETSVIRVAALLAVTPKAVEGRLYQARRTLRRLLDPASPATTFGGLLLCL